MSTSKEQEELLAKATSDLSSLGRVSHKLAMTDGGQPLEKVLSLLLPRLVSRIGTNHALQQQHTSPQLKEILGKIHAKLVEMTSHTMKRVRADGNCKLPCLALLQLLYDTDTNTAKNVDAFTMHLTLAFLNVGLPRCSLSETESLLLGLLILVGNCGGIVSQTSPAKKTQSHQVCHLLLRVVERMVQGDRPSSQISSPPSTSTLSGKNVSNEQQTNTATTTRTIMQEARQLCKDDEKVASAVFDLFLDALLYQPSSSPSMPPPGLSQAGHERLIGGSSLSAKNWAAEMSPQSRLKEFKLALLSFIAPSRRWALFGDNISRTVALLVVGSGDGHTHVAEQATHFVKSHLDDIRERNDKTNASAALGDDPIELSICLLSLVLGDGNAEAALAPTGLAHTTMRTPISSTDTTLPPKVVLSLKRRMASEPTSAAILTFLANKVLDENPSLLDGVGLESTRALATLAVQSSNRFLLSTSSGMLSTSTVKAASPYIAAAQLLNALCIRLTTRSSTLNSNDLLAKCLSTACSVLASPRPNVGAGSIAMRDACYGVVCTLSRSTQECNIFSSGKDTDNPVSIDTATLLFLCTAKEDERLRPRAVAALDALLGAYCRLVIEEPEPMEIDEQDETTNPWSQTVSDAKRHKADDNDIYMTGTNNALLARALLPLLWNAAQSSQPKASRVAAARWSSDLLKRLDLPHSCHILSFLAGDKDVTACSIAREGLGLKSIGEAYDEGDQSNMTLPDFGELTSILFAETDVSASTWRPRYFDFSYHGKGAALRFGLLCLLSDLYGGEDSAVATYVNALLETLRLFSTGCSHGQESVDLLDECSICLSGTLSTSRFARTMIVASESNFDLSDMEKLALSAASSKARRYLAEAFGHVYQDVSLWQDTSSDVQLDQWAEKCQLERPLRQCAHKLADMQNNRVGELHGAAFLGARCIRAFRLLATKTSGDGAPVNACWDDTAAILTALGRGTSHADEVIGNAFAQSLSIAYSYDGVDAPLLATRLYEATASSLTDLNAAIRKYGNGDHTDATRASTLAHAAGTVLAASTSAAGHVDKDAPNRNVGPARIQCVDALFSLIGSSAYRKDDEIALVAGEALASYTDAYSPTNAVWSSSSATWPDSYSEDYANALPPHQQVLYILLEREAKVSSPHKRTASAQALLALVARGARLANSDSELAKRALVVELVEHLVDVQRAFINLLADPKSKQLSRESCCLGLAACQGLAEAVIQADPEVQVRLRETLNNSLLHAFGQTTNFGGSALMETSAQGAERRRQENQDSGNAQSMTEPFGIEAEVGGAAGLGEAALGAYREMAAAALALGRSDVLYALLLLSVSHPVWFTPGPRDRYSASALLGENSLVGSRTNSAEMREALRPHLSKLLPRVLRACHDPNKQTREQMGTLWEGLTGGGAEARSAITQHLLPTIDILMEDASSKLWRARVGACGALADVIVGRSWDELGGGDAILDDDDIFVKTSTFSTPAGVRLLRLWRVALRALDDVRITVRESGESLARSVRSLTIRLCDPSAQSTGGNEKKLSAQEQKCADEAACAASSTALRWLVKHGLNQPCAEAVGACVSCLLGIVDVVQPVTLQPVLSDLIGALLMAMSGLEPAALNYLQVRSSGRESSRESYDRLERARLQMAQSGPIAGALNKCLEMVPSVDMSVQKEVIPQLDTALRCAAGFATRAATADAVSTLSGSAPAAFKYPGQSSTNPTVRLLRALYFASEREHGQGARDKMAHALGNLASISPGQSVRSLALRACDRYQFCMGNNDDPAARRAAAAALRAIAVRASNQLADGGPKDIWCRRVLPMAFLGRKDKEAKIASLWKEVWDEGGLASHAVDSSSRSGSSFGVLLEEKLLPDLVRACVIALNDVSWARRVAACTALTELCQQNILAPVPRSTSYSVRTSELPRSKRRAQASLSALTACVHLMVKPRIWRGKADVVKAAVKIAGQWVIICSENDCVALGWEGSTETCPWMPITVTESTFGRDLFVGDGWFDQQHSAVEPLDSSDSLASPPETSESEPMETDDTNDDQEEKTKIDFDEGDKLLTSDVETDDKRTSDDMAVSLSFSGLCKALLEQSFPTLSGTALGASDDVLPYRAASLQGLSELLSTLNDAPNMKSQQIAVYRMVAPKLLSVVDTEKRITSNVAESVPPLIVARSIDCLASAMWKGIGNEKEANPEEDVLLLAEVLQNAGGTKQPAWTVRESSVLGASSLASKCHVQSLRRHKTVDIFLDCSTHALKDRKFWRVRYAGLKLLQSLVARAGDVSTNGSATFSISGAERSTDSLQEDESQLALEALLPHKETILRLTRSALTDSESKVTALASDICSAMTWWP